MASSSTNSPAPQLNLDMNRRLNESELRALAAYGDKRWHEAGDTLFSIGQQDADLCVVISGQLNLYLKDHQGERRVAWLEPSQFTGDVSMISGQVSLVAGRMEKAGEVLHVSSQALKRLLVEHSRLSDAIVQAFIARRAWAREREMDSVVLVGRAFDQHAFSLRDLLTRHSVPHLWVEADAGEQAKIVLEQLNLNLAETPVLVTGLGAPLVQPSLSKVSKTLGLDLLPEQSCADVVVVGAGPSGLACSVYAASEGLSVVAVDANAPGGQAGASSKIENYLGFPSGISGGDLAERASLQAQKFGARLASPAIAESLEKSGARYKLHLNDGRSLSARAVVIASGAQYRDLPIENIQTYRGRGVYYGATAMEAQICKDSSITIVGAGNSAGQGAVYLSDYAKSVHVLYRRADIRETMSEYLVRRLEETPNIHLHPSSEINAVQGDGERIHTLDIKSKDGNSQLETPFIFLFIGAAPCSDWLPSTIAIDKRGFVKTGGAIENIELVKAGWDLDRMPDIYETSWPRIYAVGDVRSGSVKRVASGVGEGSVVVQYIHRAITEIASASSEN